MYQTSDQIFIALPHWQVAEVSTNLAAWPAWLGLQTAPQTDARGSLQPGSLICFEARLLLVKIALRMRVAEHLPGYHLAMQNTAGNLPLAALLEWHPERDGRTRMRLQLSGSLPALPWPLRPLAELAAKAVFQRSSIRWLARLRRTAERKECQLR